MPARWRSISPLAESRTLLHGSDLVGGLSQNHFPNHFLDIDVRECHAYRESALELREFRIGLECRLPGANEQEMAPELSGAGLDNILYMERPLWVVTYELLEFVEDQQGKRRLVWRSGLEREYV